jgi:hypothetical protein
VRRQTVINNLERCGINKRFQDCSFANIEKAGIPASIREPYRQVKGYSRKMKGNIEAGRGLLIKGSIGTMKTTLAVAVLLEYIARGGNGFFFSCSAQSNIAYLLQPFIKQLRSGETASIKVPLGSYEIRYAAGKTWYGYEYLFGPGTSYYKADQRMDFTQSGNAYQGHTIELIPGAGGNLQTSSISENNF